MKNTVKNCLLAIDYKLSADNSENTKFIGIAKTANSFYNGWGEHLCLNFADFKQEGEIVPVLFEHDRYQRIGFGRLSLNQENQNLEIEGEFLDNEEARKVIADAKQGFPFQLSVHIDAKSDRKVPKNKTEIINGLEISGETIILEDFLIREVSFTPTGVDEKTTATVLSLNQRLKMEKEDKEVEILPSREQELLDEIAKKDKEIASLKEQIENLQAIVGDLELEDKLKEEGIESSQLSASAKDFLQRADKKVRDEFLALMRSQRNEKKETAPDALFVETAPKSTEQKLSEVERYAEEKKKERKTYI